jgi:osmoprotectant transport system ATP-binding protein
LKTADNAHSAGPSAAAELELRHVSKRYAGQREPAIGDLSLRVPAGEVCVLVGPSGSGKTTAMRLINRMISISGGDILLGGRSVLERDARELRREIGYVIQQIGLFPYQTVGEQRRRAVPQSERPQLIERASADRPPSRAASPAKLGGCGAVTVAAG